VKIVRDSAVRMGLGRSFHQQRTVNENLLESDIVPLCNGSFDAPLTYRPQASGEEVDS